MDEHNQQQKQSRDDSEELLPHSFDGIQEKKGNIPKWFQGVFALSISFALMYMGYMHVWMPYFASSEAEGSASQAPAEAAAKPTGPFVYGDHLKDGALLAVGKEVYNATCTACHGQFLQGSIGPNLVDDYWMKGDSYADVEKNVAEGVPGTGMPAWGTMLSDEKIHAVVLYIISQQGSHPVGGPGPQGTAGKLHN